MDLNQDSNSYTKGIQYLICKIIFIQKLMEKLYTIKIERKKIS